MINVGAYYLREATGTAGLEQTARTAVSRLADHHIPHLIVGGLAVQEHGYPRVTVDVDIVVPDVIEAVEYLTADLAGPFVRVRGCEDTVRDQGNEVLIKLLPAGHVLKAGCKVPFPEPQNVSEQPTFVSLEELISLKLDSWFNTPVRRLKDRTDVIELIARRRLARELVLQPAVQALYEDTWDALRAEELGAR